MELLGNKRYVICDLSEDTSLFKGYYEDYEIDVDILSKLSKSLGFSYDLYTALFRVDKNSADIMVKSMMSQNNIDKIVLLLDEENMRVINYSLDSERVPVLNKEFINRVKSLSETCEELDLSEIYYQYLLYYYLYTLLFAFKNY